MRIVAGQLGGRQFDAPKSPRTHPMSDKARGGLFNTLGDIEGLTVLDPFAGSGALSFEALSRGAARATILDQDKSAQACITKNIRLLGLEETAKLTKAGAGAWSNNNPDQQFDLVLLDPPYDDFQVSLLAKLSRHVSNDGLLVVSHPPQIEPKSPDGFELITNKNYGDAELAYFKRVNRSSPEVD